VINVLYVSPDNISGNGKFYLASRFGHIQLPRDTSRVAQKHNKTATEVKGNCQIKEVGR
jgi:hypothetical protein